MTQQRSECYRWPGQSLRIGRTNWHEMNELFYKGDNLRHSKGVGNILNSRHFERNMQIN